MCCIKPPLLAGTERFVHRLYLQAAVTRCAELLPASHYVRIVDCQLSYKVCSAVSFILLGGAETIINGFMNGFTPSQIFSAHHLKSF